jgi:protein-disulfide isomerase
MEETNTPLIESKDGLRSEIPPESGRSDTLTFKRTHVYSALLPLAFVVGLAVGYLFWGRGLDDSPVAVPQTAVGESANQAPDAQPQEIQRYEISEDDDPVFGPDNAPITIIEFSDYECPYCRKWHVETWPLLQEAYPEQIRLVYRDFPLSNIHANATPAAAAANCAGEQSRYWEFSDLLFSMSYNIDKPGYQAYADELGLDMDSFNQCLESGRYNDEVNADFEYAANLGVSSTPTFFVNGIPVVGAQPFEIFSQLIDQELAGEIP